MKSREDVLSKIMKLKALSQSSNQHEAEAAAAGAVRLMFAYKIEQAEVEAFGDEEEELVLTHVSDKKEPWQMLLLKGVAETMFCKAMIADSGMVILGKREDTSAVAYTFHYLRYTIKACIKNRVDEQRVFSFMGLGVDKHSTAGSFAAGMVQAIVTRMKLERSSQEAKQGQSTAMVHVNAQEARVNEVMKEITSPPGLLMDPITAMQWGL